MTKLSTNTIERDPNTLYVTDKELVRRLGVPEEIARAAINHLESKVGFPRKQALWGNRRYWPAVRAYLDRENGLTVEGGPQPIRIMRHAS